MIPQGSMGPPPPNRNATAPPPNRNAAGYEPSPTGTDGDQSPLSAWLGVPATPTNADPFGINAAKEEVKPRTIVRIPSGEELPSLGAAEHNEGNCRPCAHNWKAGGCSNGKNCKFCHACDAEAFKRCKKDKISKLRDEGVPRRKVEKNKSSDGTDAKTPTTEDTGVAAADAGTTEVAAATVIESQSPAPQMPSLALGEHTVTYEGTGAFVWWSLDSKSFTSSRS